MSGNRERAEVLPALDLSADQNLSLRQRAPQREPFDPEPHRERLRGAIASGLVVLFALAILASVALFWWLPDKTAELKDFLPLVLTPLTSVVSAVVGFYYGAQARRDD